MRIDREQLIKAIKFLKPAISKSDTEDAYNYLHVRIDGDICQLTASNSRIGKRVVLAKALQLDIEEAESDEPRSYEFLIDRSTLEAFEILCQKHKTRLENHAKRDQTLKIINITDNVLISHRDNLIYKQPSCTFPDLEKYFRLDRDVLAETPVWDLFVDSQYLIDSLKEFNDSIEISFNGINEHVYIQTDDASYQAFFFPIKVRGEG